MKATIILFVLVGFNLYCFSQYKNTLSLVYGAASNEVYAGNRIGGPSYQGKGESSFGLKYSRKLTKSFSLETGAEFSVNKIQQTSEFFPSRPQIITKGETKMLSVPVYASLTFLKYLFANAGITTDFETSRQANALLSNQGGMGMGLGIGGKYVFNRVAVFINPFLQEHAIIPFRSSQAKQEILEAGVKIGAGYTF